jgi:hypothetical protein
MRAAGGCQSLLREEGKLWSFTGGKFPLFNDRAYSSFMNKPKQ